MANSSVAIHSNVFSRQFLIKYPWSKCSITNMFNVNISWLMYTKTIILNANKQKTVVNLTVRWENILMKNLISGSHCFAWTNQLIIFNFFCYLQIERVYLSRGIEYSSHGQWAWILPIVEVHRMHRKSQANWNIYVYILRCVRDDVSTELHILLLFFVWNSPNKKQCIVIPQCSRSLVEWISMKPIRGNKFLFSLLKKTKWMNIFSVDRNKNEWMKGLLYTYIMAYMVLPIFILF